jgi:hypothetical protein
MQLVKHPIVLVILALWTNNSLRAQPDSLACPAGQVLETHQGIWAIPMPHGCHTQEYTDVTNSIPSSYARAHQKVLEQVKNRCGESLHQYIKLHELRKLNKPCEKAEYVYLFILPFQPGWNYRFALVTDGKGNILAPSVIPLPDASKDKPATLFIQPCEAVYAARARENVTKPLQFIQPGYSEKHNSLVWEVWGFGQMPKEKLTASPFIYDPHRDTPERIHTVALVKAGDDQVLEVEYRRNLNITIPDMDGIHALIKKRDKEKDRN